jgi:beta-lactamase regulating signal transducer with metallopeptidase domain
VIAFVLPPLLVSVLLCRAGPAVAARCSPRWATRALVVVSVATALATGLVLCAVASLGVVEIPSVGRAGHWSADAVSDRIPVPAAVGVTTGVVAAALLGAALAHFARALRNLVRAARDCRALGAGVAGLVVVDDNRVGAYAVPALRGRTVVSRSLLRCLDADERRAVLAHEAAHLRHRHFLYVQLAELAAAANPLLRSASRAVRRTVELWADDDAARAVGDRVCVARAVAKAALAGGGRGVPEPALAVAGASDLAVRMRNLLDPAVRHTGRWVALLAAIAVVGVVSALTVGVYAHSTFETAQFVFAATR